MKTEFKEILRFMGYSMVAILWSFINKKLNPSQDETYLLGVLFVITSVWTMARIGKIEANQKKILEEQK